MNFYVHAFYLCAIYSLILAKNNFESNIRIKFSRSRRFAIIPEYKIIETYYSICSSEYTFFSSPWGIFYNFPSWQVLDTARSDLDILKWYCNPWEVCFRGAKDFYLIIKSWISYHLQIMKHQIKYFSKYFNRILYWILKNFMSITYIIWTYKCNLLCRTCLLLRKLPPTSGSFDLDKLDLLYIDDIMLSSLFASLFLRAQ